MKISRHPISLDRPVGESEDSYFGDFIEDEAAESPINAATQEMLKEKIDQVSKTLTYREREIIKLRYGLGDGYTYTLEEVGRIFKVTRERVRQIEAKAVRKLQHPGAKPATRRFPREYGLKLKPSTAGRLVSDRRFFWSRSRRTRPIREGRRETAFTQKGDPCRCPRPPTTCATCMPCTAAPRPFATAWRRTPRPSPDVAKLLRSARPLSNSPARP